MGNTYNGVYIWCCKYGENRYCERCANKKLCASKHTGLLNSCLGKLCLHPYLVVPLISTRVTLISTRVSAHCQAILLQELRQNSNQKLGPQKTPHTSPWRVSYGVSFVNICEKIHHVIMALHCMWVTEIQSFTFICTDDCFCFIEDCFNIWVRSRRYGCLVTWFCYQMIAKPGNKTATPSWPDPYQQNGELPAG